MSISSEFKEFMLRGNLVDLAIGFTVGAAFSTFAQSLVDDIIMPPLGLLLGRTDFSNAFWVLREGEEVGAPYASLDAAKEAGATTLNYGSFITNFLTLFLIAVAMFIVIRYMNRLMRSFNSDTAEAE